MKVFDVVSAVVQSEKEKISDAQFNEEAYSILEQYCDILDVFMEDGYGSKISAEIVTDKRIVKISIYVMDVTYEKGFKPKAYIELMKRAMAIRFSSAGEDMVCAEFLFPSLWV